MKYVNLGRSGIKVSELCFGILPMGPLQANLSPEKGGELIKKAFENGVNFVDTAEAYKTYDHIRYALERFPGEIVITSKSMATDYAGMENAIIEAMKSLDRDYIDIFLLHAARATVNVFEQRAGAIKCLLDYKEKGYIRAVGISTHSAKVADKSAEISELDIVYPIINKVGRGILEGSTEDMLSAIKKCHQAGKGLYAMKVLAGGNLVSDLVEAIKFGRSIEGIDSVSIGMIKQEELDLNLRIFNEEEINETDLLSTANSKKLYIYERHCKKCGACLKMCPNDALWMDINSVKVNTDRCLLCGYCNPVCPQFAIRML